MKRGRSHKKGAVSVIKAAVVCALAVIVLTCCDRPIPDIGKATDISTDAIENGEPLEPLAPLSVCVRFADGTERTLFDLSSPADAVAEFETADADALIVRPGDCGDADTVVITLESDGSEARTVELRSTDGDCEVPVGAENGGTCTFSLTVYGKDGASYYVSTARAFAEAAEKGGVVCQIADIACADALRFTEPFSWTTNGHTFVCPEIRFESDAEGELTIRNDGAYSISADVFCDAPLWDVTVLSPFDSFLETRPYRVFARTVNGRAVDCGELYIDSAEKIASVADALGEPDFISHIKRVVCEGNFTLPPLTVARDISFVFSGDVDIEGALTFEFTAWGAFSVDTTANSRDLSGKLSFETPSSDVEWRGADAPDFAFVEQYMNVRTYNGERTDALMGGEGVSRIVSGTLTDPVSGFTTRFSPDGCVISVEIGYLDALDMRSAAVTAELSDGGAAALVNEGGVWYCVATDANGKTRGYRVDVCSREYKLPVINITTNSGDDITSKEEYVRGAFSIDYNGAYDLPAISGAPMEIRGRGNSSWKLEKKPYKIKFETAQPLFGLKKAKRWVLIANHVDRSLIRNRLAYTIGGVLDNLVFVPSAFPVDVFVNGEYRGVYQLSEQVEINKGRVPGEEDSTEVDTDYLLEIGGDITDTEFGGNRFTHKLFKFVEIRDPDAKTLTKEQFDYVSGYVKSVEDAVMNGGDYESLLDVPSLVDWFLLYEFSYNLDGIFRRSDFLLKQKGGKLFFCTPWDFDYAFGNMGLDTNDYHEWISLGNPKTDAYNEYIKENIMDYLLRDENFTSQLKRRWGEVGKKMLTAALAAVDDAEENVAPSAAENFKLYDIMGKKIQFEKKATYSLTTYEAHLDYLRSFLKARYDWMDKTIGKM